MTRGRRPDPAGLQEAKGNPGKRKRRVAIEARAAAGTEIPGAAAGAHASTGARTAGGASEQGSGVTGVAGEQGVGLAGAAGTIDSRMPKELAPAAREIWAKLAPELERLKFLRATDLFAFTRYCQYAARWIEINKALKTKDLSYWTESAHGKMQRDNPQFRHLVIIEKRLEDLEDRFGLNPMARQRIMLGMAAAAPQLPFTDQVKNNQASSATAGDAHDGSAGVGTSARPADSPLGLLN